MTTEREMREDEWYRRETTPIQLTRLAVRLSEHYDVPITNMGIRGNLVHFKGYHRSRNFVLRSRHCTDGIYSVSRTDGDHNGGSADSVSAIDIQVPRAELLLMCKRLDKAVRAGILEKVTEWYGNTNGDDRVDGYDNISNRLATSDGSHLWHLHISFDRGHASDDHSDLFTILTGGSSVRVLTDLQRDQYLMSIAERLHGILSCVGIITYDLPGEELSRSEVNHLRDQLNRIEDKPSTWPEVDVIAQAIANHLATNRGFITALATEVADHFASRVSLTGTVEVAVKLPDESH